VRPLHDVAGVVAASGNDDLVVWAAQEPREPHGRVALMVDGGNHAAIHLYRRLGLTARTVAAAAIR
jgi:hypothetical protein